MICQSVLDLYRFSHLFWLFPFTSFPIYLGCACPLYLILSVDVHLKLFPLFYFIIFLEHFSKLYPTYANIPPSVFLDSRNIPSNAGQML